MLEIFSSAGGSEPVSWFTYQHKLPWCTPPQYFMCPLPVGSRASCPAYRDTSSGAKLGVSSSYKEKPLLAAHLASLDSSLQGLKSPGLPQERQRTPGWGHGQEKSSSFELDYGPKTMIQAECSSTGS